MNNLVKDYVTVDHVTGCMTRKHFLRKVDEDVLRAEDFGMELSLVSVAVDNLHDHISRYGKDTQEIILNEIAMVIRGQLRPYDALGLQDEGKLGVLLVSTTASDAYLWAESLRKRVAGHVIAIAQRTFSVTVSVGVCGLNEGMRTHDLIAGTAQVLEKAMEKGGNLVRVA
jgi:diguanylate cyclase (GGDEF)-like protein